MVLGDMDSYMQKNEILPPTYTIYRNKHKVNKRLKCRLRHHKSSREEYRQENLRYSMWGTIPSVENVAQPPLGKVSGEHGWWAGPTSVVQG